MSSPEEEDEEMTMVIDLGSYIVKAAYDSEKTCRFISHKVCVDSLTGALVEPNSASESLPLLNLDNNTITSQDALLEVLRSCWSQQYGEKKEPSETRLLLISNVTSECLKKQLAGLLFEELNVLSLCLASAGEVVAIYENEPDCMVVDVGHSETRVEAFVGWERVSSSVVRTGGMFIAATLSLEIRECNAGLVISPRELYGKFPRVLDEDLSLYSIGDVECKLIGELQGVVSLLYQIKFEIDNILITSRPSITTVYIVGGASIYISQEMLGKYCQGGVGGREIKYRLVPERNKSAWLGGSVAGGIERCSHRFYGRDVWVSGDEVPSYTPLIILGSQE